MHLSNVVSARCWGASAVALLVAVTLDRCPIATALLEHSQQCTEAGKCSERVLRPRTCQKCNQNSSYDSCNFCPSGCSNDT